MFKKGDTLDLSPDNVYQVIFEPGNSFCTGCYQQIQTLLYTVTLFWQ